jgi:hypothetical protein
LVVAAFGAKTGLSGHFEKVRTAPCGCSAGGYNTRFALILSKNFQQDASSTLTLAIRSLPRRCACGVHGAGSFATPRTPHAPLSRGLESIQNTKNLSLHPHSAVHDKFTLVQFVALLSQPVHCTNNLCVLSTSHKDTKALTLTLYSRRCVLFRTYSVLARTFWCREEYPVHTVARCTCNHSPDMCGGLELGPRGSRRSVQFADSPPLERPDL